MIALNLNPLEREPLYLQIVGQIEAAVRRSELRGGEALWSARRIASHYHISYQTAERALAELAARGVVHRSVASGTVVAEGANVREPDRRDTRVVALISCWDVWGARPTYTTAELEMWQAAAHALTAEFYGLVSVTLGSSRAGRFPLGRLAEWCRKVNFGGALVFGQMPAEGLEWLAGQGYAVAAADFEPNGLFPRVVHDNYGGMTMAVQHLIQRGHRRIGYLGGHQPYHYAIRLQAHQNTLRDAGIRSAPEHIIFVRSPGLAVADALTAWMDLPGRNRPTAIACGSDILAALFLKEMQARGLSAPETFSLSGYDDEAFAPMLHPPLTTVHVDWAEMGLAAAQLMLAALATEGGGAGAPDGALHRIVVPARLVVRDSVRSID